MGIITNSIKSIVTAVSELGANTKISNVESGIVVIEQIKRCTQRLRWVYH